MSENWRQRMKNLAKGSGDAHTPLFAPLIFAASAQIEAMQVFEIAADATQLAKCLTGTRQLLGLNSIYVSVPSAAEAEALGAELDNGQWPPVVIQGAGQSAQDITEADLLGHPRIAASIETCRRLADTTGDDVVLIAGLTGVGALVRELTQNAAVDDVEELYDHAGAMLLALVKTQGEAGINAIVLQETELPPQADDEREIWLDTLAPLVNVAKFHKLPVLMSFTLNPPESEQDWPQGVIPCVPAGSAADAQACTLNPDWSDWKHLPESENLRIAITTAEVDSNAKLADMREKIAGMSI